MDIGRYNTLREWTCHFVHCSHSGAVHGSGSKFDHIRRHWLVSIWTQTSNCGIDALLIRVDSDMVHLRGAIDSSVALVVLFADSLNALIPTISSTSWKLISFVIFIPLSFVPLNILSYTSILGIIGTVGRTSPRRS